MKLFKKLLSYIIAFTMVLSLATLLGGNVYATDQDGLSIKINSKTQGHTFEAYQIFTGDVDTNTENTNNNENTNNKILSNIQWGNGITNPTEFVNELAGNTALRTTANDNTTADFANVEMKNDAPVASSVAEKLQAIKDNATKVKAFAKVAGKNLAPSAAHSTSDSVLNADKKTYDYTITGLHAGYYLVKDGTIKGDKNGVTDKAYTAYILNVVGDTNVKEKSDIPTVDKEVEQFEDNNATSGTFQKNADHEIGKKFKFKLTASIPADVKVANYDSYELKFNDQMSNGISFDEIDSVVLSDGTLDDNNKVKEVPVPVNTTNTDHPNGYVSTASVTSLANGGSWSLTIANIKEYNLDFSKAITATVIYTAHLNENAFVNKFTGEIATTNKNEVDLEYSNNPNASGLGKTSKKDVYVFAYGIDSTKKANSATGNNLSGAKFTIKRNNEAGAALRFKLVTTKDKGTYYLLTTDAESEENHVSTTVTSGSDGKFNIRGLDEGTYYFEETEAPAGYNKVDPFTVKIAPTLGTDSKKI